MRESCFQERSLQPSEIVGPCLFAISHGKQMMLLTASVPLMFMRARSYHDCKFPIVSETLCESTTESSRLTFYGQAF